MDRTILQRNVVEAFVCMFGDALKTPDIPLTLGIFECVQRADPLVLEAVNRVLGLSSVDEFCALLEYLADFSGLNSTLGVDKCRTVLIDAGYVFIFEDGEWFWVTPDGDARFLIGNTEYDAINAAWLHLHEEEHGS